MELNFKNIKAIFQEYPYIASAYLFGSCAKKKMGPMSDVDIAILLNEGAPGGRNLIHEEDYLAYKIAKVLQIKEVDLTDLNRQRLVFKHNILKTGKLIYDANPAFRIKFVASVIKEFCDFESTLRLIERFHIQGIINRCNRL